MTLLASARLTAYLNALAAGQVSPEVAATAVVGDDVAHHVVDPAALAGLDPLGATPLRRALPAVAALEPELWVLVLPAPGRLGGLRGPRELNLAALDAGAAVVAGSGGAALVPHAVGQAVQWRLHAAERPTVPPGPYEAERALSEIVLRAAATLAALDVAAGRRPGHPPALRLAPGYDHRRQASADRAARLLQACRVALHDDGGSITSHESLARDRELRAVRDAAAEALCSAATWRS